MAELADAQDLKSCGTNLPYRFDSGRRHYFKQESTSTVGAEVGSFFLKISRRASGLSFSGSGFPSPVKGSWWMDLKYNNNHSNPFNSHDLDII